LRVPHFVGLHALQALPLIAFVLRRQRLSTDARVRMTFTAAGSYFALFAILLTQALRGQPVLNPDALTMETLGVWAVGTAICARWSVARAETLRTAQLV
jgi:hypothetical protein